MGFPNYDLTFTQYQERVRHLAVYPGQGSIQGLTYTTLGLVGEAGEVAEKVKKVLRDHGGVLTIEKKVEITKELGDVLWYIDAAAKELGLNLEDIAEACIHKLEDRKVRGKLQGEGDNR